MGSKRKESLRKTIIGNRKAQRPTKSKSQPQGAVHFGASSDNANRKLPEGASAASGHFRTKGTINRLNMYRSKPKVSKMKEEPVGPVRIRPDRRWFENTRVISQTKLAEFREALSRAADDPYNVVLKRSKLPTALFDHSDEKTEARGSSLLKIESFNQTFGPKSTRKRPRGVSEDLEELSKRVATTVERYVPESDRSLVVEDLEPRDAVREEILKKGTSGRIWRELYKVIDSSDVLVQVIDARDPMGTRSRHLEQHLKKERKHKHMILLMNKADLVPTWVAAQWAKILGREYPTLAFHASVTNPFGKQQLINLLRQYASLMKDRKHVSVGFVGFPNVGKSSIINTLKGSDKTCKVAPIPGETKIWQYVSLTNRVYLIDCPGAVPPDADKRDDVTKVLQGVVRCEKLEDPEQYVPHILARVPRSRILNKYKLPADFEWATTEEFLEVLARRMGKLKKGGEPELSAVGRIVLQDWQRGRLPYFEAPPKFGEDDEVHQEDLEWDVPNVEAGGLDGTNETTEEVPEELKH